MRRITWILSILVCFSLVLSACASSAQTEIESEPSAEEATSDISTSTDAAVEEVLDVPDGVVAPKTVAVIRNAASDDNTKQYLAGVTDTLTPLGWTVDTFVSDGNDDRNQTLVEQAIAKGYDGLILTHGQASYAYDMIKPAVDKGMKVVVFDTVIQGPNGESLPGVTSVSQNDANLAELSLNEAMQYADDGEPLKGIIVFYGPGVPPFDNRRSVWDEMVADGSIEQLELIEPDTVVNAAALVATKLEAVLPKYKEGEVDVIWAMWDEFAKGATTALLEMGRTDIKVVSIDVSDTDLNLMRENPEVWPATAAVDTHLIGQQCARLLASKFAEEETPDTYLLQGTLIHTTDLQADTTVLSLKDVSEGWGVSDDYFKPWMQTLIDNQE